MLNISPWYKDLIPVGCVVLGVILGAFVNATKDHFSNSREVNRYTQLIKEEIEIALEVSVDIVGRLCIAIDEAEDSKSVPFVYFEEISNICFAQFYHKAINAYSLADRKNINDIYYHVKKINQTQAGYVPREDATKENARGNVMKLNDILISAMKIYNAYHKIYGAPATQIVSVNKFLKIHGIKSNFYSTLSEREKKINKGEG